MPVCPKCHSNVKEGQRFCNICGTNVPASGDIPSSAVSKTFCEQCGRELNRPMKFCKYCGASQKNFAEVVGRATEVITNPATPTSDMQPEPVNQSATEVISPVPPPRPQTGPAGASQPTQAIGEQPKPSTEPIKEERTSGFQGGATSNVPPSTPINRPPYTTGESIGTPVQQS